MASWRRAKSASGLAAFVLGVTIAAVPHAAAQAPTLVKDILAGTAPSSPGLFVLVGGVTYFRANDGVNGVELWRTDGTAAGTWLVKDIAPGAVSSSPANLTDVAGTLFFTATDGANGTELWRSDGTAAGTAMVADTWPGSGSSSPRSFAVLDGKLLFVASHPSAGTMMLSSDGTGAGTVPFIALTEILFPQGLVAFDGAVYFGMNGCGARETGGLWRTTGISAGTTCIKSIGSSVANLTVAAGSIFFTANDGATGIELWKSDGTEAGTLLVKDINTGIANSAPMEMVAVGSRLFFSAFLGSSDREPFTSDGTAAGTLRLKDIGPGSTGSFPRQFTAVGSACFFTATESNGDNELWVSDGTPDGTARVRDIAPGAAASNPGSLAALDGQLLFAATDVNYDRELWRSDGTEAGTVRLKDLQPGALSSSPASLARAGSTVYFTARSGELGAELWRTDGTDVGTVFVKDLNVTADGSGPTLLTDVSGKLFFRATDEAGTELWKSDGTPTGTARVADMFPGTTSSLPEAFAAAGGRLFFTASDPASGAELRVSDGTAAGTLLVKEISAGALGSGIGALTNVQGIVYFSAIETLSPGSFGPEKLWRTDGTEAGTVRLQVVGSQNPRNLAAVGPTLYFSAECDSFVSCVPISGRELWKSDGTVAGTVLVKDIRAGSSSSSPAAMTAFKGQVFFTADDGVAGRELWRSDGTAAGTALVKDINPGTASSSPTGFVVVGETLYFAATDGAAGIELWKTDGTAAGTVLVKDIAPGAANSSPAAGVAFNGQVFFRATDGALGDELWRSDGTAAETVLVKDIAPGSVGSVASNLTRVGTTLYFSANDTVNGNELWRSDGTTAGTSLVADLNPGSDSSPASLVDVGGTLFFTAFTSALGRELWKVGGPPVPPVLSAPTSALVIGAANAVLGANFTAGSVVKLYVATASGPVTYGPYVPTGWSPTALALGIPVSVLPGNGFAAIQVVNTDTGYLESNVVGALLFGSAAAGVPTITRINGASLGPAELSVGVAHIDTVLGKGATVTIAGTGFADPVVNVFTAGGNIGPLTPIGTVTPTELRVVIPPSALTGPGNFQVVNRPSYLVSNAVSAVIGAVPTISSAVAAGGVVTVTGTGFSPLTVINLYNLQGGGVVNLGGLAGGGAKIPLSLVSDTQFTFARPAGAVAGPAFVEALNPPFIPYASSGNDPDGAFTMLAAAPLWTEERSTSPGLKPRGSDGDADGDADEDAPGDANGDGNGDADGTNDEAGTGELVRWTRAVGAAVGGDRLRGRVRGPAPTGTTDGTASGAVRSGRAGAGARSTRALLAGDGAVAWTVRAQAGDVAFGFGDADHDGTLADLVFAWRLDPMTRELQVYERGVRQAAVGTYAPGDRLRIAVRDGVVEYHRNDALVWASTRTPEYPLVADASLGSPDATLRGVRLAGRLGTVVDWAAAPGVTPSSLAVTRDGDTGADADRAGTGGGVGTGVRAGTGGDGAGDRAGTGAGPYTVRGMDADGDTGADAVRVERAGTGAGDRAGTGAGPYTVPDGPRAIAADLRGAAGIGFGDAGCDYCIIRTDDDTVQVSHAGVVRGRWPAPAGTRVRVEIGRDGLVRYRAGEVVMDQAPLGADPAALRVRGQLAAPGATIAAAADDEAR